MDVSFTNVLEGARQYFQGLPAPSTSGSLGSTSTTTTTAAPQTPPPPRLAPGSLSSSSSNSSSLAENHSLPTSSYDHGQPIEAANKSDNTLSSSASSSSSCAAAGAAAAAAASTVATTTTTTTTTTTRMSSLLVAVPSSGNDKQECDDVHVAPSYWNSSPVNSGIRSIVEPYAPQPTRVEVPDTRPSESPDEANSTTASCHSLTEMQTSSQQRQQQCQKEQQVSLIVGATSADGIYGGGTISRNSPNLHQMQPAPNRTQSPPPVYQQLNNVTRSSASSSSASSHTANEILNPHTSSYQVSENRTTNVPIVGAQRTQYYPRYHHPDITKSTPVPFTQSTIYQSVAPPLATSPSSRHQQTVIRPVELSNSPLSVAHRNTSINNNGNSNNTVVPLDHQREQLHQETSTSKYAPGLITTNHVGAMSAYPTSGLNPNIGNYRVSSYPQQQQQQQQQQGRVPNLTSQHNNEQQHRNQQLGVSHHSNSDGSVGHANVPSSAVPSANTCSPRYGNPTGHIPSPNNHHPGHIPSPHLPTASLPLPTASSAATALHPMAQQTTQQFSHLAQQPSRMGSNSGPPHAMNPSSYTSRAINPYTTGSPTCHTTVMSSQQMLPPPSSSSASSLAPSSSSSSSSSFSSHPAAPSLEQQNHHAAPTSQRQSPHVSVMHSPNGAPPHHAPSPHHATPSPHHATPSPHHHSPSPHNTTNFQPQSPSYPPSASQRVPASPLPPNPYNVPSPSQQYRATTANSYQQAPYQAASHHHHPQSSYHSFQKSSQQQSQAAFYAQSSSTGRSQYGQMSMSGGGGLPSSQNTPINPIMGNSVNEVANATNGPSYQPMGQNKIVTYNGAETKRVGASSANQVTSYGSYRMEQTTAGRSTTNSGVISNTHNLPPIASLSSYHSNRGARDSNLGKTQPINRQRTHLNSGPVNNSTIAVSSASQPIVAPSRVAEYSLGSSAVMSNDRIGGTSGGSNYSRYGGQQQQSYQTYATTIAPSHHGNNSSGGSTTVASLGPGTTRSALPSAVTIHGRSSSEPINRPGSYPTQRVGTDNATHAYKAYPYGNSQSSVQPSQPGQTTILAPIQSAPQSNGMPARKRESPLDLSVKTIKTPADSTARDDLDNCVIEKHVSSTNAMASPRSNGSRVMLPPTIQPHNSTATYANYDARSFNGARNPFNSCTGASAPQTVCAPKVDFLPDFNATSLINHHHHQHQHHHQSGLPSGNSESTTGRRVAPRPSSYEPSQRNEANPLPHVSSFKKTSLPSVPIYDGKSPSTSYTTSHDGSGGVSRQQQRYPMVDPARTGATALPPQEYPPDPSKYYHQEARGKFAQASTSSAAPTASSSASLAQSRERIGVKRPAESLCPTTGAASNKQPRLDPWRLAIDKQIQQKLSTARELLDKKQEMSMPAPIANGTPMSTSPYNRRTDNAGCQPESTRYQPYCDKRSYPESVIPVSPASSYNHPIAKTIGSYPMAQASGSQSSSYSPYRQTQRTQYATGPGAQPADQPSNTGADKRVLSLLRNSLENKQQREEQLNSQQPILVNHSQQSFQNKVVAPVEPKTNIGRHNLSPFTAASLLERNSNTPPHYKFHVPRAVDSITQEAPRSLYASRVNSSATLPGKEALLGPRVTDNQIHRDKDDGLAAILAAKIRTKGELKQVCSSQFVTKPTSLPSQDVTAMPNELEGSTSTSTPQSAGSSAGSPPKLTREKVASAPPRRRLFSRNEEDSMLVAATIPAPAPIISEASTVTARSSGFRSSSETSVFDFRESDSEGEMPVLERQTLEEMRRDRKQLSKVQPPVPLNDAVCMNFGASTDLVKIELKENEKITELDPFWTAACDKFMEQLRSGDSTTKKRGRKKKIGESSKSDEPEDEESKEASAQRPEAEIKPEDIKQETREIDEAAVAVSIEDAPSKEETRVKSEPREANSLKEEIKEAKETKRVEAKVRDDEEEKDEEEEEEEEEEEGEEDEEEDEEEAEEAEEEEKNNSDDDSDELPLIKRAAKKKYKKAESDGDDEIVSRKRRVRRGSRIKLESSSASESSSDEGSDASAAGFTHDSSVAQRLRTRKRSSTSGCQTSEGMKLRSRDTTPRKAKQEKDGKSSPAKSTTTASQKAKPKPLFGDGSDFRPGWEAEVYVYKKSLRMPPRLITVSKPSRFHRLSTSLPDLDPGSPALSVSMDSSDVCLGRKRSGDSDLESNYSFAMSGLGTGGSKIDDEEATSSTTVSCPSKTTNLRHGTSENSGSIVDLLARKVGGTGKKDARRRLKEKLDKGGKRLPRATNEPELLPTPNLSSLLASENQPKAKGKTPVKSDKSTKPINVTDSYLLGYFRKETVNNFRDTFKNNHALPNEFSTFVLKSRTRTETRVLKKQATIREVFGEERPASAPPMQNHAGDTSQDDDSQTESRGNLLGRTRKLKQKVVTRLRNVGILRSQKAIVNSKRHLLTAKKRKDLIKSLAEKTLQSLKKEAEEDEEEDEPEEEEEATPAVPEDDEEEEEDEEETEINKPEVDNNDGAEIPNKKKLKLRTGRRKFRSGFDYIRKKKKPLKKEETTPKERKRVIITRPNAECVADIQTEIRTWVIKKGVGETILHRAARLGYTDVTAYCLEKLSSAPSPKDNAGYTPLHEACSRGHLEIAKLLLAYGANASESANGGIRPLHEAAENGATELVRLLLSYGADPLLATYSGQTPLTLAVDTDAYSILEQHLNDVQGRSSTPWSFRGPASIFDLEETGYNPLEDPPNVSPEPAPDEIEMEVSDVNLPVLFSLTNDPDKWVLLQDLMTALRVKSRDALLRQINPKAAAGPPAVAHREVMREVKLHEFLEQSRCCHLLSGGERINMRGSKVTLIKYNEKVRSLLNVERVVINLR